MNRIRVFLLLLFVTLLVACGGGPARDESGAVVEEGDESVFDLSAGDCFDDPEESEGLISDLTLIPCDQPHDNEVFALVNHPAGDGEAFPGDDALDTFAEEECLPAFEEYVGLSYEESVFAYVPINPTEETWNDGDREVVCVLYDGQLEKLEGSVQGSNR